MGEIPFHVKNRYFAENVRQERRVVDMFATHTRSLRNSLKKYFY